MKPMSVSENNSEVKDKNNIVGEGTDERVYELGYLLVPTISEENLPVAYGNLKEVLATLHAGIISDEMPKMRELAYPMRKVTSNIRSKFRTAYFGWIKFTMSAPDVLELKKKLDFDPNLVRFLILKTVKENTIAGKRFVRGDMPYRKTPPIKRSGDGEITPLNKEEIDKEIDALVAA